MDCLKIRLPYKMHISVLALGAQSKCSLCLAKDETAYMLEVGGELSNLETFIAFKKNIRILEETFGIRPKVIACDMHPEYISTKYAHELKAARFCKISQVQHHKAHLTSCIVDNGIKGDVIGIIFDGTGFGEDGHIWGSEFFIGNIHNLRRVAHLKYIPMPGGEACIREPWRIGLSYLYNLYGERFKDLRIGFVSRLDRDKSKILIQMLDKDINSPLSSGMGRLFDAVSAICGICYVARYEGEAAVRLERLIPKCNREDNRNGRYKFEIDKDKGYYIANTDALIRDIVEDIERDVSRNIISLKFHNAICDMIREICKLLKRRYKIDKVCISGGVFQNRFLDRWVPFELEKIGFQVYKHRTIPCHDGGISLGQALLSTL